MSGALLPESVWRVELTRENRPAQSKTFKFLTKSSHYNIQVKRPGVFKISTVPGYPARDVIEAGTNLLLTKASPHLCGTPFYGEGVLPKGFSYRKVPQDTQRGSARKRLTLTTLSSGKEVETEVEKMETADQDKLEDKDEDSSDATRKPVADPNFLNEPVFPSLDLPADTDYVTFESEDQDGTVQGLCSDRVLMFEEVLDAYDEDNFLINEETHARKRAATVANQKAEKLKKKPIRQGPRHADSGFDEEENKCVRVYQGVWIEALSCFKGQWWVQPACKSASINPFASRPVFKEAVDCQLFVMQLSSKFDKAAAMKAKKAKTENTGYVCPVCEEVFSVCAQLTTHKRRSGHGASQCQVCSEWIPSRCAMKKHKKRQGHEVFVGQTVANKLCRASVLKEQRSKRKREEVMSKDEATQSREEKQRSFAVIFGLPFVEKDDLSVSKSSSATASSASSSEPLSSPPSPSHSVSSHHSQLSFPCSPSFSSSIPLPSPVSSPLPRESRYHKLIRVLRKTLFTETLHIPPVEDSMEMPMGDAGSDGSPALSRGVMFVELSSVKDLEQLMLLMNNGWKFDKKHTLYCKPAPEVRLSDEYYETFNRWMKRRQANGGVDWLPVFEAPREDTFFMDSGFRKNIPEKPVKQITSWFANPFASDYAGSMGVSHLLAPPEVDEEKKRLEEEEAAERERAKQSKPTHAKKAKAVEPVRVRVVHVASNPANLDPLLKLTKDANSRSPERVLQMTEDLFQKIGASDAQLGVRAEEKHTMFVAQVWLARAQAMLDLTEFANCLACTDKGSSILDAYPESEATDLSMQMVEVAEEARKGLGVGFSAPVGVSARFLIEYTLAHCPLSDNEEEGKISKTWLTQNVVDAFILPETKALGLSYVNSFVGARFGDSSMFVSHAWGATWMSLVQACVIEQVSGAASKSLQKDKLVVGAFEKDENSVATQLYEKTSSIAIRKQCEAMAEALRVCPLPTMYFWVDVFCKNQHFISSEDTAAELSSQIKGAGQMMLVLQPLESPVSLSRVWCLFEVLTCINCKTDMSVALSFDGMREMDDVIMGTRKQLVSSKVDDPMLASLMEQRKELKEDILVESAAAAVASDKAMIMDLVEGSVGISRMNDLVRRAVDGSVLAWQVSTIRHWARQRKSRKWEKRVENMEILRKEYEAAEKAMSTKR